MKAIKEMSLGELAAFVCSHLDRQGVHVVLSGGGCVSVYSRNQYQSHDLDFVENNPTGRKELRRILLEMGFEEVGRHFKHRDTPLFVEFPAGPLCIGGEAVREVKEMEFATGKLRLLTPTDCVRDRLAGFFHWQDRQCLEQAVLVASMSEGVNFTAIRQWAKREGKTGDYQDFREALLQRRKKHTKLP